MCSPVHYLETPPQPSATDANTCRRSTRLSEEVPRMATIAFDRDATAAWYAKQHLKVDGGIAEAVYLPKNSGDREIRFLEINEDMLDADDSLEPVNFGVDMGTGNEHVLWVIDLTPEQYARVREMKLSLPDTWTLDEAIHYTRDRQGDDL
jgi:hypothetical protein